MLPTLQKWWHWRHGEDCIFVSSVVIVVLLCIIFQIDTWAGLYVMCKQPEEKWDSMWLKDLDRIQVLDNVLENGRKDEYASVYWQWVREEGEVKFMLRLCGRVSSDEYIITTKQMTTPNVSHWFQVCSLSLPIKDWQTMQMTCISRPTAGCLVTLSSFQLCL